MDRFQLLGPVSPEWVRRQAAGRAGARGDLGLVTEAVERFGARRGGDLALHAAAFWPEPERPRLCAWLMGEGPAGWSILQCLLAQDPWRAACAFALLDGPPRPEIVERLVRTYPPRDPVARSLLLFLAGRREEWEQLDFERAFLRDALARLDRPRRLRLMSRLAQEGLSELLVEERVAWHRLTSEELDARLTSLSNLVRVLPKLRLDQAAQVLLRLGRPERWAELEVPDPEELQRSLRCPLVLRRESALVVSPGGTHLLRRYEDWFEVMELSSGRSALIPAPCPREARFSRDGTLLATRSSQVLELWAPLEQQTPLFRCAETMAYDFCDRELFVAYRGGGMNHVARVFPSGTVGEPLWMPPEEVLCMALAGSRAMMGTRSGHALYWPGSEWTLPYMTAREGQPTRHAAAVGNARIATANGRTITLWECLRGEPQRITRVSMRGPVRCLLGEPSGRWLVAGDREGRVMLLDLHGSAQANLSPTDSPITALAVRDGLVLAGQEDGRIRFWIPRSGESRELLAGGCVDQLLVTRQGLWVRCGEQADLWSLEAEPASLPLERLVQVPRGPLPGAAARFMQELVHELHRHDVILEEGQLPPGAWDLTLE